MIDSTLEGLTLKDIAEYFRKKYPDVAKVVFTVGYHGHSLALENYYKDSGLFTMRNLGGEWIEEGK